MEYTVTEVDFSRRLLFVERGCPSKEEKKEVKTIQDELKKELLHFDKLCICSGAKPRFVYDHPDFLFIRDTESVEILSKRLSSGQKIAIIGNGGNCMYSLATLCNRF